MAWSYNQTFDALNDGDLNGQDSWSGGTGYDVVSTGAYKGGKAEWCLSTDGDTVISRVITGVTDGTMYVVLRIDDWGNANNEHHFYLYDDGGYKLTDFGLRNESGGILKYSYRGTTQESLGAGLTDTWYIFCIEYNTNADQTFRLKWKVDGGTYSAFTDWKLSNNASFDGTIAMVRINTEGGNWGGWVDEIGDTDPSGGAAVTYNAPFFGCNC